MPFLEGYLMDAKAPVGELINLKWGQFSLNLNISLEKSAMRFM